MEASEKEKISLEKAMEILQRDGINISIQEAKVILEFYYKVAEILVDQYLSKQS